MTRRAVSVGVLLTLLLMLPENASAAVATARREEAVPQSIDASGATDVTAPLNSFMARLANHSVVRFPRGARYRIEGIVLLGNHDDVIIEGNGATFFATTDGRGAAPAGPPGVRGNWPRHRSHWIVFNSSNITVRNIVIVGANQRAGLEEAAYNAALEAQSGFEFYATSNSSLESCSISYTYGDHVYIGHGSKGIRVSGCTLTRSGRQSISVTNATDVVLENNVISRIRRSAIDLEPNGASASVVGVSILNNRIGVIRLDVVAAKGASDVSNITIAGNRLLGQPMIIRNNPPPGLRPRRHDWSVIGNTSDTPLGSPHGAYWITSTDHVTIRGNTQPLASRRPTRQLDVELDGCTSVVVEGNNFPRV